MIHHLSFPSGGFVNDFFRQNCIQCTMHQFHDAVRMINSIGRSNTVTKSDFRSAFRIIPVHSIDYYVLGLHQKGHYYADCCMPMGLASSCKTFEILSTALEWVARSKLILHISLYPVRSVSIAADRE